MKDLKYLQLFDTYGPLLTETQREMCELYYLCDLSLSEIAEATGVSRQAVHDGILRAEAKLEEYERTLGLAAKRGERMRLLREAVEALDGADAAKAKQILVRMLEMEE